MLNVLPDMISEVICFQLNKMTTFAAICGVLGLLAYFFYYTIAKSSSGDDGQGVNLDAIVHDSSESVCASQQKGRWD